MSITRRGLLGALIGSPLACMVAQDASLPKLTKKITVVPASFSKRRIEDIVQAGIIYIRESLRRQGIQTQLTIDNSLMSGPHGYAFLIPHEDHIQSMDFILESFIGPLAYGLAEFLHKNNRSKCRFINIEVRSHHEGFQFWVSVTQQEKPNYYPESLYEAWARV